MACSSSSAGPGLHRMGALIDLVVSRCAVLDELMLHWLLSCALETCCYTSF